MRLQVTQDAPLAVVLRGEKPGWRTVTETLKCRCQARRRQHRLSACHPVRGLGMRHTREAHPGIAHQVFEERDHPRAPHDGDLAKASRQTRVQYRPDDEARVSLEQPPPPIRCSTPAQVHHQPLALPDPLGVRPCDDRTHHDGARLVLLWRQSREALRPIQLGAPQRLGHAAAHPQQAVHHEERLRRAQRQSPRIAVHHGEHPPRLRRQTRHGWIRRARWNHVVEHVGRP